MEAQPELINSADMLGGVTEKNLDGAIPIKEDTGDTCAVSSTEQSTANMKEENVKDEVNEDLGKRDGSDLYSYIGLDCQKNKNKK